MTVAAYIKDPNERSPFPIDWTLDLELGDTITASTWAVPTGITSDTPTFTINGTNVFLSGGTAGTTYLVVNHITTASGCTFDQTLIILVLDK